MKAIAALALVGGALAAPTKTVESRQFPGLGSLPGLGSSSGSSTDSGLGSFASLFPGLGSSSGSSLPGLGGSSTGSGLGSLSSLIPGLGGSSTSSGLGSLSSLIPGLGGSSSSGSGIPGLGSSTGNIPDLSSLLGGSSSGGLPGLTKRASITENGVTQNSGCQELTFIFARGTSEMGNMGSVVGPPVANQLASLTGNKVTVQGVDYPADAAGNAMMGASGGPKMAELIQQAKKQCPNTKVVLGGYSQGAMVVHNAASKVGADAISGAVLFGDPFKTQGVGQLASSKVKEYCASGDPVCQNGMNFMAHLSYGSNAQEAAQFLVQAAGL
ncbi:cutinase-domain-containing protein [Aspergillus pseudotamarii]|uniref:Cutinase n=1 Tax=Aspergillus pseudotamarii TaxID=132259 RepID=A0A5N6SX09_ASPPS|nr:cutinase-domain-containing protein [Aspergillus pseudotamarii]KAE8139206.1 cutinase-domain-containing protein [Aspergillus pseudotamarii]